MLETFNNIVDGRDITVVQLESTNVCQAECPQCPRETDPTFDKNNHHHLTVSAVRKLLSDEFVQKLEKMFICGNYGDPAAGLYTLDIYKWFRTINPTITLGMHSNGGLRSTDWWKELAGTLNLNNDYVVFSIDGLEDTNHLYRVNVDWKKLMKNCQAYIDAGGKAHWDMLIYNHNEHQVEMCQSLAKEMGFTWFRAKVSKRPLRANLQYPLGWKKTHLTGTTISCHALNERSLYIDSKGNPSPCCWLNMNNKNLLKDFRAIQSSWQTQNPETICLESCMVTPTGTSFSDQWRTEICL